MAVVLEKTTGIRYDQLRANKAKFADRIAFIRSIILDNINTQYLKKIYLFGSYANGNADEDSDIDICVVIDNMGDRRKSYMDIAIPFARNNICPCDLLVYTEAEFYGSPREGNFEDTIRKDGILLYGEK